MPWQQWPCQAPGSIRFPTFRSLPKCHLSGRPTLTTPSRASSSLSLLEAHLALQASAATACTPTSLPAPFGGTSVGRSLATGRHQTSYLPKREGRRERLFFHPLPLALPHPLWLLEAAEVNTYRYVNRLKPCGDILEILPEFTPPHPTQ